VNFFVAIKKGGHPVKVLKFSDDELKNLSFDDLARAAEKAKRPKEEPAPSEGPETKPQPERTAKS